MKWRSFTSISTPHSSNTLVLFIASSFTNPVACQVFISASLFEIGSKSFTEHAKKGPPFSAYSIFLSPTEIFIVGGIVLVKVVEVVCKVFHRLEVHNVDI